VSVTRSTPLVLLVFLLACAKPGEEAYGRGMDAYAKKHYAESARYLEKGAQEGHLLSMATLATLYLKGTGIPPDPRKAAFWFEQAAIGGNVISQSIIGLLYFNGIGVKQDLGQARKWLAKAAANGDTKSAWVLENLAERGALRL
jgi:TPR repeat protein